MRKVFILFVVPFLMTVPGCSFFQNVFGGGLVKKYDPFTVDQIDKTVAYENAVFELLNKELTAYSAVQDPAKLQGMVDQSKLEIKVRHDGEIARLASWRMVEGAKEGAPKPTTSTPVVTTPTTTTGGGGQ